MCTYELTWQQEGTTLTPPEIALIDVVEPMWAKFRRKGMKKPLPMTDEAKSARKGKGSHLEDYPNRGTEG